MTKWKCSVCGWTYDPAQGDPKKGISQGTAFEDLPDSWVCPICQSGKELFEPEFSALGPNFEQYRFDTSGQTQQDTASGTHMFKDRFENVFRIAQKLTSSLKISEVLEMIRDEARATVPQMQEVCLLVIDPEAQHYTRPLHCAMVRERINCQLCKRGRAAVTWALDQTSANGYLLLDEHGNCVSSDNLSPNSFSEIVFPICEQGKPLAVLDAILWPGASLGEKDFILLNDLVQLASNVIKNAKSHWRMSQEKLTVDRILDHLRPFVPATVQRIVEKDPEAPDLEKKDVDVTVLFLDVAGYTRISETQSMDKVTFIIEKYFSSFLDIIYVYGGDINETAGDGLMVIFQGDPRKTALSAVKAALDIREKTLEINEELKNRFPPVEINMGINSGMGAVGMSRFSGISGTRMTFTATGPVTNLAARIASAARHGDIFVGPETAQRVREDIRLADKGLMTFKNVAEPVEVFSPLWDMEKERSGAAGEF